MDRRTFIEASAGLAAGASLPVASAARARAADPLGSAVNTPMAQRQGRVATVYFTRDLSAAGLAKIYARVSSVLHGRVAVKLHTGEPHGPNIIPRDWVRNLVKKIPDAKIVETNTYYAGGRDTTEKHRETLKTNGWTFCPVDILDETGVVDFPVKGGRLCKSISVGRNLLNYDSMLVLTHFKGHVVGGFGGSNKNIGIGCAGAHTGKKWIHTYPGQGQWSIVKDDFMERMTESTKGTIDHFGKSICYINVMRNMSVSCDCEGVNAAKPTCPDIGIVASLDILAADQACVDMVYALGDASRDLRERMETRHGLRQLSYMRELGLGSDRYELVDLDRA